MKLFQISLKQLIVNWLLHEPIEALLPIITELILWHGSVSYNHEILLPPLFNIGVNDLPNLSGCLHAIHSRHIDVHDNELIGI